MGNKWEYILCIIYGRRLWEAGINVRIWQIWHLKYGMPRHKGNRLALMILLHLGAGLRLLSRDMLIMCKVVAWLSIVWLMLDLFYLSRY